MDFHGTLRRESVALGPYRSFFDLPVYRLSETKYDAELDQFVKQHPSTLRDHFWRSFGGCWRYNEIIGYIQLYFSGNQILGEYFSVSRKRLERTRTKTFEWQSWKIAPEITIEDPVTDESVLRAIEAYIAACEKRLPRHVVDISLFSRISKHIKWRNCFEKPDHGGIQATRGKLLEGLGKLAVTEKGLITFAAVNLPSPPAVPRRETDETFFSILRRSSVSSSDLSAAEPDES